MKKCLSLIIALVITVSVFPAVYAEENTENESIITYNLSLEDAIEMAFTDNERLEANRHKQSANEIAVNSAYLSRKPYKNMTVNVTSNFELYCLKEGYYIKAAEMAHRLSKAEEEKIKSSISYDVTNAYYNLVLMRKLTNAANNAYTLALANQEIVDKQYALGFIPKLDYETASLATLGAKSALDSYTLNEEIAVENLKILLNIDGENCTINLTDEIECEEFISDCEADIKSAVNTRYDLCALKESEELAWEYFDLSTVLTENSATYNSAYASYVEARYTYNSTVKLIKLSMKSSYNNILTTKESMDIAAMQYDIKRREYDAAKIKYDLGVIANIELTKAINDLYDAQVSYANAKLNYRMAIEKYKYEITTGL